ncbi:MAG: PAS domain S-box protein [Candidatus Electrothrix sp. ATG1]|nr:PAS domain S-box protein [Candidatus Electrothrix sp. ATG1]
MLSLNGTYEMVNGLYADVFGYSRTEFQNMQLQDIMHPDDAAATEEVMEFLRYGQLDQHYADKKFIRKDGSVFPGGHWLSPRRIGHGTCNGFVCIISDLTEQKKAEGELRLAHTVFETSSEGMLVTDAENRIIMVNPAFTAITGYQREQAHSCCALRRLIWVETLAISSEGSYGFTRKSEPPTLKPRILSATSLIAVKKRTGISARTGSFFNCAHT